MGSFVYGFGMLLGGLGIVLGWSWDRFGIVFVIVLASFWDSCWIVFGSIRDCLGSVRQVFGHVLHMCWHGVFIVLLRGLLCFFVLFGGGGLLATGYWLLATATGYC